MILWLCVVRCDLVVVCCQVCDLVVVCCQVCDLVVVCCQVRCDSGITEGSEISLFYDPMICKVCTLSFPLSTWCPVSVHSLCSIHSLFAQGPLCVHCVSTDCSIHQMFTQCLLSVLTGHPVSTEIGSVVYYRVIYLNRSVQTLMLI